MDSITHLEEIGGVALVEQIPVPQRFLFKLPHQISVVNSEFVCVRFRHCGGRIRSFETQRNASKQQHQWQRAHNGQWTRRHEQNT